jgi:hypothetical protein
MNQRVLEDWGWGLRKKDGKADIKKKVKLPK